MVIGIILVIVAGIIIIFALRKNAKSVDKVDRFTQRVEKNSTSAVTRTITPDNLVAEPKSSLSKKEKDNVIAKLSDKKLSNDQREKIVIELSKRGVSKKEIGEILEMMEGDLSSVNCLVEGADKCPRADFCPTLPLWTEYNKMTRDLIAEKEKCACICTFFTEAFF